MKNLIYFLFFIVILTDQIPPYFGPMDFNISGKTIDFYPGKMKCIGGTARRQGNLYPKKITCNKYGKKWNCFSTLNKLVSLGKTEVTCFMNDKCTLEYELNYKEKYGYWTQIGLSLLLLFLIYKCFCCCCCPGRNKPQIIYKNNKKKKKKRKQNEWAKYSKKKEDKWSGSEESSEEETEEEVTNWVSRIFNSFWSKVINRE